MNNYVIKRNYAFDEDDCHNVVFCHLSISSTFSNLDQLRTILGKNPVIMCISDTWLCDYILDIDLCIPGYQNIYTAKIELLK